MHLIINVQLIAEKKILDVEYEKEKYGEKESNSNILSVYTSSDGKVQRAKINVYECRMGYGYQRKYPNNGDRTGGMDRTQKAVLSFDRNGIPKIFFRRNHPRTVQEPVTVFHFGANCDIKFLLTNNISEQRVTDRGLNYEDFCDNLHELKMDGLDQYTANTVIIDYATGYVTKGSKSNADYEKLLEDMETTLSEETEQNKEGSNVVDDKPSMNKLLGKYMIQLLNSKQFTSDEAIYCSSGGKLVYMTMKSRSCSVKDVYLEDFQDEKSDSPHAKKSTSWTWESLIRRYKDYSNPSRNNPIKNFYSWCSENSVRGQEIVPSFFGYQERSTWPPSEEFSKVSLTIYKPFSKEKSVKDGFDTFKDALVAFLPDPLFPRDIAARIRRQKNNIKYHSTEEGFFGMNQDSGNFTPPKVGEKNIEDALNLSTNIMVTDAIEDLNDEVQHVELSLKDLKDFDRGKHLNWAKKIAMEALTWTHIQRNFIRATVQIKFRHLIMMCFVQKMHKNLHRHLLLHWFYTK